MQLLAGLEVTTKSVERIAEAIGGDIAQREQGEIQKALQLDLPVIAGEPIPILYVQMDGTGVPVVKKETLGRQGKADGQPAHTREVKLGCVFRQTTWDAEGFALRDPDSTTYTGAIETAEEFGKRIYLEALTRGWNRAKKKVVIGDGAEWIWNLVAEHFPEAIQIVDLYHARQHLWAVARQLYPQEEAQQKAWMKVHQKRDGTLHLLDPSAELSMAKDAGNGVCRCGKRPLRRSEPGWQREEPCRCPNCSSVWRRILDSLRLRIHPAQARPNCETSLPFADHEARAPTRPEAHLRFNCSTGHERSSKGRAVGWLREDANHGDVHASGSVGETGSPGIGGTSETAFRALQGYRQADRIATGGHFYADQKALKMIHWRACWRQARRNNTLRITAFTLSKA